MIRAFATVLGVLAFAVGAAVLCVVMIGVQLPRFFGPEKVGVPSVAVRVVTANLGFGRADPRAMTELASATADVLVIQELTPDAATGLSSAGSTSSSRTASSTPANERTGSGSGADTRSSSPRTSTATRCRC